MSLKIIFTFLLISGFTVAASHGGCAAYDMDSKSRCIMCFESQLSVDSKCVRKYTDDMCILRFYGGYCALCEEGFAASITVSQDSNHDFKCVKAEVPKNCVNAQIIGNQVTCKTCKNGFYPNFSGTACDTESDLENCLWAARSFKGNQAICWRCKDGYLANKDGKCVEQKDLVGCLGTRDETNCCACDTWNGYFMKSAGKCSK